MDWTLCPEDRGKELRLREVRNQMIKEQLLLGKPVIYRSSGWSLYPRVWSNDLCTYEPVTSAEVCFDCLCFVTIVSIVSIVTILSIVDLISIFS